MIKEMQINATIKYHLWNIKLAKTKKNGNTNTGKDKWRKHSHYLLGEREV